MEGWKLVADDIACLVYDVMHFFQIRYNLAKGEEKTSHVGHDKPTCKDTEKKEDQYTYWKMHRSSLRGCTSMMGSSASNLFLFYKADPLDPRSSQWSTHLSLFSQPLLQRCIETGSSVVAGGSCEEEETHPSLGKRVHFWGGSMSMLVSVNRSSAWVSMYTGYMSVTQSLLPATPWEPEG